MRKHYDFSNAIKNPHAGKFKDGYTVIVEHKDFDEIITVKKTTKLKGQSNNNVTVASSADAVAEIRTEYNRTKS